MEAVEHLDAQAASRETLPPGDWLSPNDLERSFHLSHTTAWRVCKAMPHLRVGKRGIRVARKDVLDAVRDGRLETGSRQA